MIRSNPPRGFTSRDWSEEIGAEEPTATTPLEPNDAAQNSPTTTQVAEDRADEPGDLSALPTLNRWVEVVSKFISRCDHLDEAIQLKQESSSGDDHSRTSSRGSSRGSVVSEGHVSPEEDGPSKKVVRYDDHVSRDSSESSGPD